MIITGLLDSTLEECLVVKAEGTDGGSRNWTHMQKCTQMGARTEIHKYTNSQSYFLYMLLMKVKR